MAGQLKSLITFQDVPVGESRQLAHRLKTNADRGLVPDVLTPSVVGAALLGADDTQVTVTNLTDQLLTIVVLCESWHSFERSFGAQDVVNLDPKPFVAARDLAATITATNDFIAVNGDSITLLPGMPVVAGSVSGQVKRGDATSAATSTIFGLVVRGAAPTLAIRIQPTSDVILTTQQWDAVTGGSGGLIPGGRYYLDTSPGMITTTPPAAPGTSLTAIGRALSNTQLILNIQAYLFQ